MRCLACLWMLVTLFGALGGPDRLRLPDQHPHHAAPRWWAAGLTKCLSRLLCSATLWVMYLRSRRLRHLFLTLVSVVIGVGFYEKALIIGVVLAFLALGYFASRRLVDVVRAYWPPCARGGVLAGGYHHYLFNVPRPFESSSSWDVVADDIANSMLGTSLPTGLLGGPWRWWNTTPPIAREPPGWTVHLAG